LDGAHEDVQAVVALVSRALMNERKLDELDNIMVGKTVSKTPIQPDASREQRWVQKVGEIGRRVVHQKVALLVKRAVEESPPVQTLKAEVRQELMVAVDKGALAELQAEMSRIEASAPAQASQAPIIIPPVGGTMGPHPQGHGGSTAKKKP